MSRQDEDEVEDELQDLEQEVTGERKLPEVPTSELPEDTRQKEEKRRTPARERTKDDTALLA